MDECERQKRNEKEDIFRKQENSIGDKEHNWKRIDRRKESNEISNPIHFGF